ncbi:MAG: nicotinate-nucleotide diphosphorylase [Pirellulales bacterium]|nr:nicotinate-nucleotide diphosphorylase [Pirellulales bacterium]
MHKEFQQTAWDDRLRADWDAILRLAIREDIGEEGDWTTNALVAENALGSAAIVARRPGLAAGLAAVEMTLQAVDSRLQWIPDLEDGQPVGPGIRAGIIRGPVRGMLSAERIVLNLICRLSGIATLTREYVEAVAGTKARIYDTRKTAPGWRRLEKYAVRCGGGWNHRGGLFEAVLIKDNHLAWGGGSGQSTANLGATGILPVPDEGRIRYTPAEAVQIARAYVENHRNTSLPSPLSPHPSPPIIVEVEVDTLEQLADVLPVGPDIVLLDNMSPEQLRNAVALRDRLNAAVELEASGGISLQTIRAVAESGVERISVGALTHSAAALDFGLDWLE